MKHITITLLLMLLVAVAGALPGSRAACAADAKYDFQLDDLTSRSDVLMSELSDKPLVVHVWAPDCPSCKRNMPFVKALLGKLDLKAVNFVAASMGSQPETRDYVDEHELDFNVLYKGHSKDYISDNFTDDGWPTTFVFAPGGQLIGTCDEQGSEYETRMLELIGEAVAKIAPHDEPATAAPNVAEIQPAVHKVVHWWESKHPTAKPETEPEDKPQPEPPAEPQPEPAPDEQD